jgi:hypothetical protein
MSAHSSPCPFFASGMIENPNSFIGRKLALDEITARMTASQPTSVNVVGKPRIGKSSLLYHFCQTYEQRAIQRNRRSEEFIAVFISLQGNRWKKEEDFYQAIATALLQRPIVSSNPQLANCLQMQSFERHEFRQMLEAWKATKVLPVICMDEFDKLLRNRSVFDPAFYQGLRALLDANLLMLVVSSTKPLDQNPWLSSFFNLGHTSYLENLTEMEAGDLVQLPRSTDPSQEFALSENRQKLALQWGERNPYLLQLAAVCLWEAREYDQSDEWARERFEKEAHKAKRYWLDPRGFVSPLRWLCWDLPSAVGRLVGVLGVKVSDMRNWIVGIVIIIVILALVLRLVNWQEVREILKKALGY